MCAIVGLSASLPSPHVPFCVAWLLSLLILLSSVAPQKYPALFLARIHFNVHVKNTAS